MQCRPIHLTHPQFSRRTAIQAGAVGLLALEMNHLPALRAADEPTAQATPSAESTFSLAELQRRTFLYFWELADPATGLIPDRAPTQRFSSIAATGFGLTSYCVGIERAYIERSEGAARVQKTLQFLWNLPQADSPEEIGGYRGFFYHFLNINTGHRYKQVELSTIDTALLMAGALSCASYFDREDEVESEIRRLADALYRRVEWNWALRDSGRLSMGWHPEKGFIEHEWRGYNEAMILYVLAIGSPAYAIPKQSWSAWASSYRWESFHGQEHVNFGPLFGHHYSHMYIDFRGIQDAFMRAKGIDYFENARRATLGQRAYAVANPGGFRGYSGNVWGLTACDGPENAERTWRDRTVRVRTYAARGVSAIRTIDDGTIAPTAAGGSIPFAPEICIPTLRHLWDTYPSELVGRYGFRDAFNLTFGFDEDTSIGWFDRDYLGIDQGPILIQIANHRDAMVWETMKRNRYIVAGLRRAGFSGGWLAARGKETPAIR